MSRLNPVWSHFWANQKLYQRFWQNGGTALGPGAVLTVDASLLPGAASGEANAAGAGLLVDVVFFDGHAGIDATAPLNLRLNARYRHFWSRRQTWRHFWAQYEGAGISDHFENGQLVVSSLAVVVNGTVTADANLDGVSMTVGVSLLDGVNTITHGGQTLQADVSLLDGAVYGEANAEGAGLLVAVSLLSGVTAVFTPGQTLPVTVSLVAGAAEGESNAVGTVLPVAVSLLSGASTGTANAAGELLQVDASLIDGIVFVPPDVLTIGKLLPVQVSLLSGNAIGGVEVEGATMVVAASLLNGAVSVTVPGKVLVVSASLAKIGVAAVTEVRIGSKFAGSVRTERRREERVDAKAHGAMVGMSFGMLTGRVTIVNPTMELLSAGRAEVVYEPPVVYVLPDEVVRNDVTVTGVMFVRTPSLASGGASGGAVLDGALIEDVLDDPDETLWEADYEYE